MIEIDGSQGEGGGQVLRTALSMSALLGAPFVIRNIRAGRKKPGLAPQHLTGVRAAAEICAAKVSGDELGSQQVTFEPGEIRAGSFEFDVAAEKPSAGSTSLVLQTILPPLLFAPGRSEVTIRGGTHVPWSPTFEYLDRVFKSGLYCMLTMTKTGPSVGLELHRAGWYPRGGGRIIAEIRPLKQPGESLRPIRWLGPPWTGLDIVSTVSEQLPDHIAPRQIRGVEQTFGKLIAKLYRHDIVRRPPGGPGTAVLICRDFAGYSALGERGKPAEQVGAEAAAQFLKFLDSGAAVDERLADQLLIYLAIADGTSEFTTPEITQHLHTNAWVIKQFLPVEVEFGKGPSDAPLVRVHGTRITRQEG